MTRPRPRNAITALRWAVPAAAVLWLAGAALAWWLLAGCAPDDSACPLPDEQVAIVAAAMAWSEIPYPLAGCDLGALHSHTAADAAAFASLCRADPVRHCMPPARCAYACYLREQSDPSWPPGPLIVLAPGLTSDERASVSSHEALHWAGDCSGRGQDYAHADRAVWGTGGAQARARSFLGVFERH